MYHYFNIYIAKEYGILEAILIQNLWFWIEKNKANEKFYYENDYWTYNSIKAFKQLFPYVSEKQIKYALEKLKDKGIIKTANFNETTYDRTLWYTFTDFGKSIIQNWQMHFPNLANGNDKIGKPIPNNNIYNNINNNIYQPFDKNENDLNQVKNQGQEIGQIDLLTNMFNEFWSAYPRKVKKKDAEKSFSKIKNLDKIFPQIMSKLEEHKKSKEWQQNNGQYIPHPTTWLNQRRWEDEESQNFNANDFFNNVDLNGWGNHEEM